MCTCKRDCELSKNPFVRFDSIRSLVKIARHRFSYFLKLSLLAELSYLLQYSNSRVSFRSISRSQIILCEEKIPKVVIYYGVFTLSDTENETDTETDNKCTELNGNLCCYLSQCSVKCSAYKWNPSLSFSFLVSLSGSV